MWRQLKTDQVDVDEDPATHKTCVWIKKGIYMGRFLGWPNEWGMGTPSMLMLLQFVLCRAPHTLQKPTLENRHFSYGSVPKGLTAEHCHWRRH